MSDQPTTETVYRIVKEGDEEHPGRCVTLTTSRAKAYQIVKEMPGYVVIETTAAPSVARSLHPDH